mmetsp:Transcript_23179/g.58753  ORF Transcript_23179/g.58753 Transcript_23179/m.58753 type:complete len:176 (-) Transcript_23179:157-684(-)
MSSMKVPMGVHEDIATRKWLKLRAFKYADQNGKEFEWEYIERTTRRGEVDAAEVLPIFVGEDGERHILLVSQFRPPVGKISIEFPAGLIDEGESVEEAAARELQEEAGCTGVCILSTPPVSLEASVINEIVQIYAFEVTEKGLSRELDEAEAAHGLNVFSCRLSTLKETLDGEHW